MLDALTELFLNSDKDQHYLYFMSAVLQGTAALVAVVGALFIFRSQALKESLQVIKADEFLNYFKLNGYGSIVRGDLKVAMETFHGQRVSTSDLDEIRGQLEDALSNKELQGRHSLTVLKKALQNGKASRDVFKRVSTHRDSVKCWVKWSIIVYLGFIFATGFLLAFPVTNKQTALLGAVFVFFCVIALTLKTLLVCFSDPE